MKQQIYDSIGNRLLSLKKHNIILDDIEIHVMKVAEIGYYRISQIIKRINEEDPKRKVELSKIIDIFYGEQALRGLLNELISYWEISLRTLMSETYSLWLGGFGYKDSQFFEDKKLHHVLMNKIEKQLDMKTLYEVIDDHKHETLEHLPIWVASELSTFHMLTLMYKLLPAKQQRSISSGFELEPDVFLSWIEYILVVRNACAHQGLLFNRYFERAAILPKGMEQNVYAGLYILEHLLAQSKIIDVRATIDQKNNFPELKGFKKYYGLSE